MFIFSHLLLIIFYIEVKTNYEKSSICCIITMRYLKILSTPHRLASVYFELNPFLKVRPRKLIAEAINFLLEQPIVDFSGLLAISS